MTDDRALALQLKDLLTVCLGKGIDIALTAQLGEQWFADFAKEDAVQKKQILMEGQISIYASDTQALFKILRFREKYSQIILTHFGFISRNGAPDDASKKLQFSRLMDRLITDFRNSIEAHIPVYALEQPDSEALYSYIDAVTDMLKLAEIFRDVRDADGRSYYDRMKQLADDFARQKNRHVYPVKDIAASLSVTPDQLILCCEKLHIPLSTVNGSLCITTENYTADISRIRAHFALAEASRSKKSKRFTIAVVSAIAAIVVMIGIAVWISTTPTHPENNYYIYDGTVTVAEDKVDLILKHIYWENDVLIAKCIITNGYDTPVANITVTDFTVKNQNGIIANQSFGVINNGNALSSGEHIEWIFTFDKDSVSIPNADLTDNDLSINVSIPNNLLTFLTQEQ